MKNFPSWKPSASVSTLIKRASIIANIRKFFNDSGFLEVETPYLSTSSTTDVYINTFETKFKIPNYSKFIKLYLVTSAEHHMKRLLAADLGPIFQISRNFRNEEIGRYHNPEFTMLEWYSPNYTMQQIIYEVDTFLQKVLGCNEAEIFSYQEIFQNYFDIDPLSSSIDDLNRLAIKFNLNNDNIYLNNSNEENYDILLQLLLKFGIEPFIGNKRPTIIFNFPANQASLAKINIKDRRVAERFEVYYKGIELANGFVELTDAAEQKERFIKDNNKRALIGLPKQPIDMNFLDALKAGIPDSAGVALGIDRLIMLALNKKHISDVISFNIENA